jgi:spore coat protein H
MTPENPKPVPVTIEFNGLARTNVGVCYQGNLSLRSGWSSGSLKLPLKLDFDEFEDEYPKIENQRILFFSVPSLDGDSWLTRSEDRAYHFDTTD